jgi:hypothetical protein
MKPGDLVYLYEQGDEVLFFMGTFEGPCYDIPAGMPALVLAISQSLDYEHDDDQITVLVDKKVGWAFRLECLKNPLFPIE